MSTAVVYGAAAIGLPTGVPSTWNSTLATPMSSVAVAVRVSVPPRFAASVAGAVSVATGAVVSVPPGVGAEPPPPQPNNTDAPATATNAWRMRIILSLP